MARKSPQKQSQPRFNPQWHTFADCYLANGFNGTKAAIEAGYAPKGAHVQASRLLKNAKVIDYIESRMKALSMRADEVIYRLSEHGRGDLRDFAGLTIGELKEHPKGWLIKKVKSSTRVLLDGSLEQKVELEIHDPQAALALMAKIRKLLVERVDHTTAGMPLDWRAEALAAGVNPDLLKEQRVQELMQALQKDIL